MTPSTRQTTPSNKSRADQSAALVNTLYSLTVDSVDYEEFIQSWGAVSDNWAADLSAHTESRSEREQQALLEHFQRAEQIFMRIGRKQGSTTDLQSLVDSKSHAALVVDASGRLVAANPELQQLTRNEIVGAPISQLFKELIGGADEAFAANSEQLIGAEHSKLVLIQDEPCLLISTPLADGQHTMVDFSRASWHDDLESDLRSIFSLSLSEVAICHLLYEGYEVKEIAELRSRAEDTVRKQIKSILTKSRCTRQADFMRLLTGMLVMGQMAKPEVQINSGLVNSRSVRLPDDRELYYFLLTPPQELRQTVVIAHGIASSPIFPRAFVDALLDAGIAILGVSRPGYGRSSPLPAGTDPLSQFAHDLTHLLDHLQLSQVSLISMQSGAMFSFAALAQLNSRIHRMVCIAPIIPLATSDEIAALPIGLKILARTKKLFPAFFPLVIQAVLKRVDAGEVDSLYRSWYKGVPCDLAVLTDPESRQLLDSWLRFCGAQGGEPYINDAGYVLSDWSELVKRSTTPVQILHGDEDQTVKHGAVQKFVAAHPNMELKTISNTGQLMILAKPDLVARGAIDFLS